MSSLRASCSLAFPLRLQPFKDKSLMVIGDAYLSLVCLFFHDLNVGNGGNVGRWNNLNEQQIASERYVRNAWGILISASISRNSALRRDPNAREIKPRQLIESSSSAWPGRISESCRVFCSTFPLAGFVSAELSLDARRTLYSTTETFL
jgi:hypothetical protein